MTEIRKYRPADCEEIIRLFYETIHSVNLRDYTAEQADAWASGEEDPVLWNQSLTDHFTAVAVSEGRLTGFGDIDDTGYLDRLYVHKDFQNRGIATMLCDCLETHVRPAVITTFASVTALPFFLSRGYEVIRKNEAIRKGVRLTNYMMQKEMP